MEPGSQLGPYQMISRLGAGGMGEVWKASDTRLGRSVAVKILKGSGHDAEARRRLVREAQIASKLTHPNICTLHDVGTEGDVDYLVMELLEGETLLDRLAAGSLPSRDALRIAREVAAALAHAHGLGFVHRDLKPSNIFMTASGTKLLDFGLARAGGPAEAGVSGLETASALTTPGTVLGTVGYMSPEQVRGEPADSRSDVFSFGTVLYEMLSGRRAFPGDTAVESLHAILKGQPPPLDVRGPAGGLERLLGRCLAKEPADRFPSGRELLAALGPLPDDAAAASAPPPPARRLPAGRMAKIALTLAGLALAIAVGLVYRRSGLRQRLDSLAVLPFANATGDPGLAYLSDGLAESLIQTLARAPNLRVMAMSSVTRFRADAADPVAVGRELGVGGILTGTVRSLGDTLAVSAALVDATDGRQLWGDTFERTGVRIPTLQSEIAGEIVRALRLRLPGEAYQRLARAPTEDREAYLLWLQGRYRLAKRTDAEIQKALALFRQALDRDPTYAQAWAGTAAAWDVLGYTGLREPAEAFPRSRDAARKALDLDPSNTDALAVLAHVTWLFEKNAAESERIFRKALTIDPNAADARHWYAHFLSQTGRLAESAEQGKKLLELEPLSLVANLHLAEELDAEGRFDDAAAQLRKTIDLDRSFYPAWMSLGKVEAKRGRPKEALAALQEAVRLEPSSPPLKKALAVAETAAAQSPR